MTVAGCTFTSNQAVVNTDPSVAPDQGFGAYGGAIWADGGSLQVTHSQFAGNSAQGGYGNLIGGVAYGGAVGWAPVEDATAWVISMTGDTFTTNGVTGGSSGTSGVGGVGAGALSRSRRA